MNMGTNAVTKQEILDGFGGKYTLDEAKTILRRLEKYGISDGHHTFDELYEHRCALFANLCLMQPEKCSWKYDFEGWFCLYLELPTGQISYHLPLKLLSLISGKIKNNPEHKWDGHNSEQVLERLLNPTPKD